MAYKKEEIEKIFNSICIKIENGKPLRQILKEKNMPSSKTFFEWIDKDEEKIKRYARACEERADAIFEDMIEIADNQEGDVLQVGDKEIVNHNQINRAKLRVDTRKWILSKMNPKKYGDKLELEQKITKLNGITFDE
jgi:hypothetical protein